ncbi:MAG: hypothetical protein AAFZ63_12765 [Bacteroidota bacterium]
MKTKKFFALLAGAAMLVAAVAFTNNVSTTADDSQATALFVAEDNVALAEGGGTCFYLPFFHCYRQGGNPIMHFLNSWS